MRFYTSQHQHTCGIDLHARTMYVCILSQDGTTLVEKNIPACPAPFLKLIAPYREDLVVGVECIFTWYWMADLCEEEGIPFLLGHALYRKAIHGGKAKNDRIDANKIAALLRGGMFPMAYVYPREMRSTRDLLRRRLHLVRLRGRLLAHIQNLNHQSNFNAFPKKLQYKANRKDVLERFKDPSLRKNVELDLSLIDLYDELIRKLEYCLVRQAKIHDADMFHRLRSIRGVGKILAMTILYEVHDIDRFPSVQQFASYCRLVKCARESAGKKKGTGGSKIGNVHLKWAFSEAAVLFLARNPRGQKYLAKLTQKHGKGKALSILAHKLGRAAYIVMSRRTNFDEKKFFAAIS